MENHMIVEYMNRKYEVILDIQRLLLFLGMPTAYLTRYIKEHGID